MISVIRKILGIGPAVDYLALMSRGAMIIDVRTKQEFRQGHINGSVNIPLNELSAHMGRLQIERPVITCCASGLRSGQAKVMLKSKGFEVYNGGGWTNLNRKVK